MRAAINKHSKASKCNHKPRKTQISSGLQIEFTNGLRTKNDYIKIEPRNELQR